MLIFTKNFPIRPVLLITLLFYAALLVVVWTAPMAFTACSIDSFWCSTAFWLTQSAGKYGTLIIVFAAGYLYTIRLNSARERVKIFSRTTIALLVILSVFAFVNEHATKKLLRAPRPSHTYVLSKAGSHIDLDSMYRLEKEQRQKFFIELISSSPMLKQNIDQKVLDHWVEEAGYSFPSGHSFNAFLLATILSFSIYHTRFRKLFFLPMIWAVAIGISRVAIGAHTPLDVSAGAALGILIAAVFLYFDTTRNLFIRKKSHT